LSVRHEHNFAIFAHAQNRGGARGRAHERPRRKRADMTGGRGSRGELLRDTTKHGRNLRETVWISSDVDFGFSRRFERAGAFL
jgi:hypothetical protein